MRQGRGNGSGAAAANENNEGDPRLAGLTPLGERPICQLVAKGPFRGIPAALVLQTLAVMPGLAARGPQAARGARGLAAAAVPAAAGGGIAGAQAGAAAANIAIGGAAAVDRWDPRVPHFELEREVVVMDVPMRITEFNELVSISLDGLVRPVVNLLYGGEVNGEAVRELVEITTDSIRPALENFVEQLSSRSIAARIAIDTTRHRAYIDRLATTSRGTHRAEIIRQLQHEYNETIQPLGPALETDPSIGQRTWAFFSRSPPPAARGDDSLLFQGPGAGAGAGAVGPVVPPGVGAAALPAGVGGAVAGYIPSERDIRRRDLVVRQKLRKTYEAAAKFAQNYRVPNQENVLARCPNIMKSLYTNILTALVEYTTVLIHTIRYRVDREGVLDRAHSTAGAQAAITEQTGENQVELTFQNLRGVRFLSRDQIDNLMDQLILITVNYMNISPDFRNLLPLISQIYGISTVYVVVADGDQDRGIEGPVLGAVFSEYLQQLVADITREAVVMSDRYVINGNAWFNTDGLAGKLGALGSVVDKFTLGIGSKLTSAVAKSSVAKMFSKTTLAKLILPTKRVQINTTTEAGAHTTTVGRQTHYAVAAEAAGILGDIAHPLWVAFDRLLELVDPVEFNQTMELTDGSRQAVRGNLRVAAKQAVEIGADIAGSVGNIMSRLNHRLHGRLAAVGASGHAQTIVTALAGLDDNSAAMIMREVADQGSYQQMRATLLITQGSPNIRELEAMQGTPLSRRLAKAVNEGTRFTPMYVSVTGQRVPNTNWDRYAVFLNFYKAFTKYSTAEEGTARYSDFSAYIHSPLIYPHLLRFSQEDLFMMYQPIAGMERNEEWVNRYGEIIRLIDAAIESKQRLGAALANQTNNDNSYHASVNNYNSNRNSNLNNANGNNANGNNANGNNYAENMGPYGPNAPQNNNQNNNQNNQNDDYGYTHGHDVITGIKYIINYGNTSTVRQTPEYMSWTTYVDSVQFAQWLDSFTNAQLDNLEKEIRSSLLYRFNDPLAVKLLGYVVDERSNPVRRPAASRPSGQTGFASFFSQPKVNRNDNRDRDAALAALSNNPTFASVYDALMWYDEEEYGTERFMRFRKFIQNRLPALIHTFTNEELRQLNEYAYASMTQDNRYDDLVQIISQVEIARANGNNGMNDNQSRKTNNTEGYNGPMAMAGPDGIDQSLMRLNANSTYENFYDTILWFDEEDYGSESFMSFQQFVQTKLRQIIITFRDEQLEQLWNHMLQTGISDDRYDDVTSIVGRERARRGVGRVTTGRVNFNALARQGSRMSRSSSGSNSTFSSLNSSEKRHWNMFPNNLEQTLTQDPQINPMKSYSAAKYKNKKSKTKSKTASKGAKSKRNRGRGKMDGGSHKKRHTLKGRKRVTLKVTK